MAVGVWDSDGLSGPGEGEKNFENRPERVGGLVQASQTPVPRLGHRKLISEHVLKTVLEDHEGLAANLMRAAAGRPKDALDAVEAVIFSADGDGVSLCKGGAWERTA